MHCRPRLHNPHGPRPHNSAVLTVPPPLKGPTEPLWSDEGGKCKRKCSSWESALVVSVPTRSLGLPLVPHVRGFWTRHPGHRPRPSAPCITDRGSRQGSHALCSSVPSRDRGGDNNPLPHGHTGTRHSSGDQMIPAHQPHANTSWLRAAGLWVSAAISSTNAAAGEGLPSGPGAQKTPLGFPWRLPR